MNREQISAFTNRITQSNKSELICVLFDIFFTYINEAKENEGKESVSALRHAGQVIEHLKGALDFKYELSYQLYPIYDFCERVVAKSMYMGYTEELDRVEKVMLSLSDAFNQVAKEDNSEAMMKNAQKITAGYTYGRNDIVETGDNIYGNRGFLV